MEENEHSIVPDIFSDLFNINENALGVMVVLHRSEPILSQGQTTAPSGKTVAVLRFSPENWKTLLMVGRKQLKARETANGQLLKLPPDLLQALGLTEADW